MCANIEELQYRIHQMRKNMILIAGETGLNSDDTICYSQKLDELITKYQKLKMSNTQNLYAQYERNLVHNVEKVTVSIE